MTAINHQPSVTAHRIYTKTGDTGTTGLFGNKRVSKNHKRIHAYGTVDELNACIGYLISLFASEQRLEQAVKIQVCEALHSIQEKLFVVGARLATPQKTPLQIPHLTLQDVARIEEQIDMLQAQLPPLKHFLLPSGVPAAAWCHVVRTVCRRAERYIVALHEEEHVAPEVLRYMNRLSDYFFVFARFVNHKARVPEFEWHAREK